MSDIDFYIIFIHWAKVGTISGRDRKNQTKTAGDVIRKNHTNQDKILGKIGTKLAGETGQIRDKIRTISDRADKIEKIGMKAFLAPSDLKFWLRHCTHNITKKIVKSPGPEMVRTQGKDTKKGT